MVCKRRDSTRNHKKEGVTCSAMHNSQCGLVHIKAGGCTKVPSDGIWYKKGSSGVQNLYWIAFGTPDRAIGNTRQATRIWFANGHKRTGKHLAQKHLKRGVLFNIGIL